MQSHASNLAAPPRMLWMCTSTFRKEPPPLHVYTCPFSVYPPPPPWRWRHKWMIRVLKTSDKCVVRLFQPLPDCPQNVNIDPQPNVDGHYFIGQIVNCSAEGFPDPVFKWINLVTNETTSGPTFNVTTSGSYDFQCVASNIINGEECTTSGTVSAQVIGKLTEMC